jgi:hypothetical protein
MARRGVVADQPLAFHAIAEADHDEKHPEPPATDSAALATRSALRTRSSGALGRENHLGFSGGRL